MAKQASTPVYSDQFKPEVGAASLSIPFNASLKL